MRRTFPTTYVAYPSPTLVLQSPIPTQKGVELTSCLLSTTEILMPPTATPQLIFPWTSGIEYPGTDIAYAYLDNLATVSELISGGTPASCFHGLPPTETNTPVILPLEPITHSSVSVLTQVGRPVTLSVPPVDGDDGSQPTSSDDGGSPQSEILGSNSPLPPPQTGDGGPPVTRIVV